MRHIKLLITLIVSSFVAPLPVYAQWTDGQNAEFVMGQPDFMSSGANVTSNTMLTPHGVAIDFTNGKIYIAEQNNDRIMRYDYPITGNQPTADLVFGQPDFITNGDNTGGLGPASLNFCVDLAIDSTGRLWVTDTQNHRVLWYNAAHTLATNQPNANGVLGQANFISNSDNRGGSTTANSMSFPIGIEIDPSDNLWVADRSNNRVLRFDNPSAKANGADADGVLGQANFTSNSSGLSATQFNIPYSMAFDGTTMFLADFPNSRVLRFENAASKANGAAADGVLGQSLFTTDTTGTTAGLFNFAHRVATDQSGRLYVSDWQNHRIMIFNDAKNKVDGAAADNVLGQPDFITGTPGTTQSGLRFPGSMEVDRVNGKLVAAELGNNRVVVYDASAPLPVSVSAFELE